MPKPRSHTRQFFIIVFEFYFIVLFYDLLKDSLNMDMLAFFIFALVIFALLISWGVLPS